MLCDFVVAFDILSAHWKYSARTQDESDSEYCLMIWDLCLPAGFNKRLNRTRVLSMSIPDPDNNTVLSHLDKNKFNKICFVKRQCSFIMKKKNPQT